MIDIMTTSGLPMEPQVFLAAQALLNGELVIFPSETVYGIAADAVNDDAIEHLISIKGRAAEKALPVMIKDIDMADGLADIGAARALAKDYWPGPLTLVLPSRAIINEHCIPDGWIGLRCPNHPIALTILQICNIPLAVTSANTSGQPPACTSTEVRRLFEGRDIAFRITQSMPTQGQPSTVLKIEEKKWTILRQGSLRADIIKTYLPQNVSLITA